MEHKIDYEAEWVQVGRGGSIKGGKLSGWLKFENELTTEQFAAIPADGLGHPVIQYINSQPKHAKKKIIKVTVEVAY